MSFIKIKAGGVAVLLDRLKLGGKLETFPYRLFNYTQCDAIEMEWTNQIWTCYFEPPTDAVAGLLSDGRWVGDKTAIICIDRTLRSFSFINLHPVRNCLIYRNKINFSIRNQSANSWSERKTRRNRTFKF